MSTSEPHPLDAVVRADHEYRRLFREWTENPTAEGWAAMNRAVDELGRAADRLQALLAENRRDVG